MESSADFNSKVLQICEFYYKHRLNFEVSNETFYRAAQHHYIFIGVLFVHFFSTEEIVSGFVHKSPRLDSEKLTAMREIFKDWMKL